MTFNPVIWAGVGGVFGGLIGIIANWTGNPMPQSVIACAMGGFFFAWLLCLFGNWLIGRSSD